MKYKFRGFYHKESSLLYPEIKKWVFGSLIEEPDGTYWIQNGGHSFKVIPETVGQYININDTNKKEIYAGDVLMASIYTDDEGQECTVEQRGSAWIIDYEDSEADCFIVSEFPGSLIVIGTIHDEVTP